MKCACQKLNRPPPPRAEACCPRGQQQIRYHRFHSNAATCLRCPPAVFRRGRRSPCLAQFATPAVDSRCTAQPKPLLAQWHAWRVVRSVGLAATCCAACLSLAFTMQTSAPFAAASLTFRSAAQTGTALCRPLLPVQRACISSAAGGLHNNEASRALYCADLQVCGEPPGVRLLALELASCTLWRVLTTWRCVACAFSSFHLC